MNKYINIKTVGIGLLAFLALCLFLSKTIYSFNMPQVTATIPFSGKLNKTEITSGVADWSEKEQVRPETGGKVVEILVKEGDQVTRGQELIRLSFNHNDTRKKIDELRVARAKLELDLENINVKIAKITEDLAVLEEEQSREVEKAQTAYDRTETLYEHEAATASELETAAYNLESTVAKYEKQITDLKANLVTYEQDIKAKELDIENNEIQTRPYQKTLSASNRITAPVAGTVGSISVQKGDMVNDNQSVLTIGVGNLFSVQCTIPIENSFVALSDKCRLSNSMHSFNGVVEKIQTNDRNKTVTIAVTGEKISVGETFSVTFSKEGERTERIVANGAVMQDSNGYYLQKIKRRKGVLGNEYYTEKLRIYIGDSDNTNTVILNDIGFFEPVVLSSNKSFADGDSINLKNGSDFFARN